MTREPLRILAVVPTLGGGGAEKHVERIANSVDRNEAHIDVGVARRGGRYERFLHDDVRLIGLGHDAIRSSTVASAATFPRLVAEMRSGRWDAVVAFLERPALVALAAHAATPRGRRPALLLSVQADPVSIIADDPLGPIFEAAMRRLYRRADGVIAISEGVASTLRGFDPSLAPVVVPNACLDAPSAVRPSTPRDPATVVACGRFVPQKGFDVLVESFAEVVRSVPDARLRILGTGPDESALRARIARLGLEGAVELPGFVDAPLDAFARGTVFCLSSRFEGLGMVIVEAMSVGTPIVSTDCPHGPREILEGGRFGRLVPRDDPAALARALIELLKDPDERARLARIGLARADDYGSSLVAARYVAAVRDAISRRDSRRANRRS